MKARRIGALDTLLAIGFKPYADETIGAVCEVRDAEVEGFRALSAAMCLSLTLVVALGRRDNQA